MPRRKKAEKFVDPFDESAVVQRKDKPEPSNGEKRFYFYYNRVDQGGMRLRMGGRLYILKDVDSNVPTWSVSVSEREPLKKVMAGNARRIFISNDIAVLS